MCRLWLAWLCLHIFNRRWFELASLTAFRNGNAVLLSDDCPVNSMAVFGLFGEIIDRRTHTFNPILPSSLSSRNPDSDGMGTGAEGGLIGNVERREGGRVDYL